MGTKSEMSDEQPRILIDRDDGSVVTVTLNRPDARNALDVPMIESFHSALDDLESDESIAALVLRGAGDKAFVAGADIAQLRERGAAEAFRRINQGLFRRLEDFPAPTIAAVRGWALGGGCELAMSCDLRVAAEGSSFGQPEVGLGIIPGAGATHRLQRLVGVGRARELIYTGRIIDAHTALEIGLVNRVVPDDEWMASALDLAREIARNSRSAVRLAKLAINHAEEAGGRTRDLVEVLSQAICFESQDKYDRMTAFLERKKKR